MKVFFILVLLSVLFSANVFSAEACKVELQFITQPEQRKQVLELSPEINLALVQMISTQNVEGAKVASNFICQQMTGANYTGSQEEWKRFINSAIQGLTNKGYQDVKFIPIKPESKVYKTSLQSIEYNFIATRDNNTQHIHNLAVLDTVKNAVYTISVSGNELAKNQIEREFERLVASFIIKVENNTES